MLSKLSSVYEIIVFTSSHRFYADSILDYIDRNHVWIHHRLYRDSCVSCENNIYVKDLRTLNRDLKNVIIADNAAYAFAFQLENGYPIIPFYDCKEDREIKKLTEYLMKIQDVEDVRVENRARFHLRQLLETDIGKFIQYYRPVDGNSTERSNETVQTLTDEDPTVSNKIKVALKDYQKDLEQFCKRINNN